MRVRTVFRALATVYGGASLLAVLIIPINVNGWFGLAPDPWLSVPALLLAAPWLPLLRAAPHLGMAGNLALLAACLAANVVILLMLGEGLARAVSFARSRLGRP